MVPTTHCLEIIEEAKTRGVLEVGNESEGGFALWEICRGLGLGTSLSPTGLRWRLMWLGVRRETDSRV